MAASPHLRPERSTPDSTPLAPVAYNSAAKVERAVDGSMGDDWKQFEGQTVDGKFRLQQYLGGSDDGAVFLTEGNESPQKAAIKLIPAVPGNIENQILHWKLAMKLPHPNLLRIFAAGQWELNGKQLLYVVMEYAEEDLSQILPHRPLTADEARQMLSPVLDALSFLHSKGFVHGSLKSSNIHAISDQVKLSSDSLAAIIEQDHPSTRRSHGAYDPPEAADGKNSAAGDVWALGVTLCEILTLHRPAFDATRKQEPVLPKELEDPFRIFVRNCLRLEAKSRWTVAQIKALLEPGSASQRPPSATQSRKIPIWLYLAPAIALVLLVAFIARPKRVSPSHTEAGEAQVTAAPKPTPSMPQAKHVASQVSQAAQLPAVSAPPGKAQASGVPASVLHQVLPDVPESAMSTISGKLHVRVKVSVDAAGNVTEASLDSAGPSKYFARLAVQAAEKWKFAPAQVNGQPAPSEWLLRFGFTSSATDVASQQLTP